MSFYSNLPSTQNESSSIATLYPTIFEVISSQEIDTLLPASVRYLIVNYWIARYPSKFTLQVNNYFHEWFDLLLKGAVEWYHISRYNSTFVDKFYGLKRFNSTNKVLVRAQATSLAAAKTNYWPSGLTLSSKQRRILFLEKIILPYLRQKLDEFHSQYVAQSAFSTIKPNKLKAWIIEQGYPLVKKILYLLNLLTKLFFLSGKIGSVSFLDYLFNIEFTRITQPLEPPLAKIANGEGKNRLPRQNLYSLWHQCSRALTKCSQILSYSGSQVFPAFIFMLRVYQWWTTQDLTAKLQRKLNDVDKDIPRAGNSSDVSYRSTEMCPICQKHIQNPAVLETGFAVCYPCATEYLPKNEGRCPVTNKRLLGCVYDSEKGSWQIISGVRRLLL